MATTKLRPFRKLDKHFFAYAIKAGVVQEETCLFEIDARSYKAAYRELNRTDVQLSKTALHDVDADDAE